MHYPNQAQADDSSMWFEFKPMKDSELLDLIPDKTVCQLEVIGAVAHSAASGKKMIKLTMMAIAHGNRKMIVDFFDPSSQEVFPARKFKHACYCFGLQDMYESGRVSSSAFNGKKGSGIIGIQKDKGGEYPDKNSIRDYLDPVSPSAAITMAGKPDSFLSRNSGIKTADFNDDIPF